MIFKNIPQIVYRDTKMSGLQNHIENIISKYITAYSEKVSEKYSIPVEELLELWEGKTKSETKKETKSVPKKAKTPPKNKDTEEKSNAEDDLDPVYLQQCGKSELAAICKRYSLKVSGTKQELLDRILNRDSQPEKKSAPKKAGGKKKSDPKIIQDIKENTEAIKICRNKWNNYEHQETGLVFDQQSQRAIGKQSDTGDVLELTEDDIETCKKYHFLYLIPENLDKNKKVLDNVKVKELEDIEEDEGDDIEELDELADEEDVE